MAKPLRRLAGFTLIELLAVMVIIAILVGLVFAALHGVINKSDRDRARAEIRTMEAALEGYKSDNGGYPPAGTVGFTATNQYITSSPLLSGGLYQGSSAFLYEQLSGFTNANYMYTSGAVPPGHAYYSFQRGQLANNKIGASKPIYIKDPFGNSYGYFFSTNSALPFNGTNQYDLWSTAGETANPPTNIPAWITDWGN